MTEEKKRILIADSSKDLFRNLSAAPGAERYLFETALTGEETLEKIAAFQPDLILLDLMLPGMHGIEILRRVRSNPKTKHLGIIICSSYAMIQNHHAAIKEGVNYFLERPFKSEYFFALVERFFGGTLQPEAFSGKESQAMEGGHCYVPRLHSPDCYIKFWGTRGSNPVAGPEYVRFGGNTSCLEIRYGGDLIIIDAGTGIRPLGNTASVANAKSIHLIISHTHWDHITGFPFFTPLYNPDCHVSIWAPIGFEKTTKELFTDMLAYTYFPVRLDDIQAKLTFKDLRDGEPFSIGDIWIQSHYAYHPGATLCFKIRVAKTTFGYATDNELLMGYHGNPNAIHKEHPFLAPHQSLIKFYKDCDFLIHEAQYSPQEYQRKVGWGHSSISNAAVLIKHTGVKDWIVTHHDPKHTDEDLQKKFQLHKDIMDDCHIHCHVRMAFDSLILPL